MNDYIKDLISIFLSLIVGILVGYAFTTKYWKEQAIKYGVAEYRLVTSNKQDVIFIWKN